MIIEGCDLSTNGRCVWILEDDALQQGQKDEVASRPFPFTLGPIVRRSSV